MQTAESGDQSGVISCHVAACICLLSSIGGLSHRSAPAVDSRRGATARLAWPQVPMSLATVLRQRPLSHRANCHPRPPRQAPERDNPSIGPSELIRSKPQRLGREAVSPDDQ